MPGGLPYKIHLLTGRTFPDNRTDTCCGRVIAEKYERPYGATEPVPIWRDRQGLEVLVTVDRDRVTCKSCLKRIT